MTELTKGQLASVGRLLLDADPIDPIHMACRHLLRDREAICERLECEIASLEALKDGCMAGLDMSVSDNAKALAKANAFQHSADRLRALLSELRGGK